MLSRQHTLVLDVVVDARRPDARLAGPRVDLRARLARAHVPYARLVPQVAHLCIVAALRTVLNGGRDYLGRLAGGTGGLHWSLATLTEKSHWNGWNELTRAIGVGSRTHCSACQLFTNHTSFMALMVSRNLMKPSLW